MDAPTATEHEVVIAGAGPSGMMMAAELTLAGVDTVVVERRTTQELDTPRARGLHSRTIEVLDQRGVVDRFLEEGQPYPVVGFSYIPLDVSDLPTRHNYLLALDQREVERLLAGWIDELGVPVIRGRDVVALTQDDTGVHIDLSEGPAMRGRYLIGCDGGRSLVRTAAGIGFPGFDPSVSFVMADVDMAEDPPLGIRPEGGGIGPAGADGAKRFGVVVREPSTEHSAEPTLDDLRQALRATYGTDFGAHDPGPISRFTDMTRQADAYRNARVFLVGDAAHIHAPFGGQGLNVGMQDAVNLGWKLAQVLRGDSPDSLLDTYHAERHPVGERVQHNTMAQTALNQADERHRALHATLTDLLGDDEPRRRIAAMIAGLDVHYDLGDGHPLLGRRMPDLDIVVDGGPTRVFELLHEAQPVLIDFSGSLRADPTSQWRRVRHVRADHIGAWELPVLGEVEAAPAVLMRPDGHVAWVGEPDDPELPGVVAHWFGEPDGPVA